MESSLKIDCNDLITGLVFESLRSKIVFYLGVVSSGVHVCVPMLMSLCEREQFGLAGY